MLVQHLRRWTNIEPTLGGRLVFAGMGPWHVYKPSSPGVHYKQFHSVDSRVRALCSSKKAEKNVSNLDEGFVETIASSEEREQ